jgi:hypothetical protein
MEITQTEVLKNQHILREPNSIIVLLSLSDLGKTHACKKEHFFDQAI